MYKWSGAAFDSTNRKWHSNVYGASFQDQGLDIIFNSDIISRIGKLQDHEKQIFYLKNTAYFFER